MKKIVFTKTYSSNIFLSLEDDRLDDICIRETSKLNIGDIYLGRVVSIKEDINSAFVSLKNGKIGFIRCKDLISREEKSKLSARGIKVRDVKIKNLISLGQEILVQVAREATASKNPMMIKEISLSNKFMAILIEPDNIFYSKKIKSFSEKRRLKEFAERNELTNKYSIIFRRQSLNVTDDILLEAYKSLANQMDVIVKKSKYSMAPVKMYDAKNFIIEMLESNVKEDVDEIYVEDNESKLIVKNYLTNYGNYIGNPSVIDKYENLCNFFDVSSYLENLMNNRVNLKEGGDICIESTEAMTVIDVNSKGFVANERILETAWYINLNALKEIKRQLRLRDVGGIIIIDFVNFKNSENESKFLEAIKETFRDTEVRVEGFTRLGLLELTRKRTASGILEKLFSDCRCCSGEGKVPSRELIFMKLESVIYSWKMNKSSDVIKVEMKDNQKKFVLENMQKEISELESIHKIRIEMI